MSARSRSARQEASWHPCLQRRIVKRMNATATPVEGVIALATQNVAIVERALLVVLVEIVGMHPPVPASRVKDVKNANANVVIALNPRDVRVGVVVLLISAAKIQVVVASVTSALTTCVTILVQLKSASVNVTENAVRTVVMSTAMIPPALANTTATTVAVPKYFLKLRLILAFFGGPPCVCCPYS